ncbi:MAG: precorrin-6A reductase [Synergistes sp.]|nr:precorrin-6A reductase [Synergistes sp.]
MTVNKLKKVLLFGGTTEGRELTRFGLPMIYCAAGEYGADLARGAKNTEIVAGRMDASEMEKFIKEKNIACVIDATHPYAREASENIRKASSAAGVPLMRVTRGKAANSENCVRVKSAAEAAEFLERESGAVLLTTGSKDLAAFNAISDRTRLFARVLPDPEVIKKCFECGFDSGHIIAMQGPFSRAMNEEMLRKAGARWLVTKDGGDAGGTAEKFEAARACGAQVVLVERPGGDEGHTSAEALLWARRILGIARPPLFPLLTDIEGQSAVIAGGGKVAARRAATLLKCGAAVTVISPKIAEEFSALKKYEAGDAADLCETQERVIGSLRIVEKEWEPSDLDGASIAVAATDDAAINAAVGAEAKSRGIPVSVADDASACTFCFPSLIASGEVSVSVSAGALSPALTHRLAKRLRAVWDEWVAQERGALEDKDNEK